MKTSVSFLVLALTLVLTGCVHTRTVDFNRDAPPSLARINKLGARKTATVTLSDGRSFKARSVQVTPDSTSWWQHGRWETVPTPAISAIQFENRGRSVLIGTVAGAVVGALVSHGLGTKDVRDECISRTTECFFLMCFDVCRQWSYREERVLSYEAGAALGTGLGLLVGSISGSEMVYRFDAPVPAPPVVVEDLEQQRPARK